jgi:aminoglycoside phosphotransferase (APT) family kinase protein
MTMAEPTLLARGRDADVYALDDATVLRRVRVPGSSRTLHEAKVMTYLAEHGFPVPRVLDADEDSMVMQRLTGHTLLEDVGRRPWTLRANARILARLHEDLAAIPAPDWLAAPRAQSGPPPERRSVLHLDLHPGNVIVTPAGPVVIDWTTSAAGDPALDLAKTLVTLDTVELPTAFQRLLCRRYVRALRRAARTDPGPRIADAVAEKLLDPNISPAEAARLRALSAPGTDGARGPGGLAAQADQDPAAS